MMGVRVVVVVLEHWRLLLAMMELLLLKMMVMVANKLVLGRLAVQRLMALIVEHSLERGRLRLVLLLVLHKGRRHLAIHGTCAPYMVAVQGRHGASNGNSAGCRSGAADGRNCTLVQVQVVGAPLGRYRRIGARFLWLVVMVVVVVLLLLLLLHLKVNTIVVFVGSIRSRV